MIAPFIRRGARRVLDFWMPGLGYAYRQYRDQRANRRPPVETPFGFKLTGNAAMARGAFEADEIELFAKHLDKASVCIDIGANIGLYTCLAAAKGKHVVAIEPLPANLDALYRNLADNEFLNVEVCPVGLSSTSGKKRLFGANTGASFVSGWEGASDRRHVVVPVSTLDLIVDSRFDGQALLIKIDVEGFEHEVLLGASRTLDRQPRPTWLVEICLSEHFPSGINEKFHQTFELFWRHGYQASTATRDQRPIHAADVERWVKQGHVDFGSYNYLFS